MTNSPLCDPLAADFLFLSPHQSFAAQGCFARVQQPAYDGAQIKGSFQQSVRAAFARARQAGIAAPRLCGVIPFNRHNSPALFIAERWQTLDRQAITADLTPLPPPLSVIKRQELPQKAEFIRMVQQAVQAISQQHISKVVLSRLLELQIARPLHRAQLLRRVIAANPADFCFSFASEQGILFGASPELLLRKSGKQFFSVPLAGTARRADTLPDDQQQAQQLLACTKDQHEHRLVIDAMRDLLTPHCLQLHIPDSPQLHHTASLWHLSTPLSGTVDCRQQNALSLACLLHPTPALCGVPATAAASLIRDLEPFDRGPFGGIIGWCDEQGNGEWVVVIRCGLYQQQRVRLFAGVGVVAGSQPEAEWAETCAKLATMGVHFVGGE